MKELRCDLIVGPITTVEKEDETVYSAPLSGKSDDDVITMTVKCRNRDVLEEYGVGSVGNRVTVVLHPTNSQLSDFE